MRVKGSERRPFLFIFRLSIVQCDLYQADENVMEIDKWNQKIAGDYVKVISKVSLNVLEISVVS